MILEFRCSNFKSIRNEISFTSVAGSDTSHSDELIQFNDEYRVIRSAAVYGANGSGKSNFIQAIGFMKKLVSESIGLQPGQSISGEAGRKGGHKTGSCPVPSDPTTHSQSSVPRIALHP